MVAALTNPPFDMVSVPVPELPTIRLALSVQVDPPPLTVASNSHFGFCSWRAR
jgi:hypothetical protein